MTQTTPGNTQPTELSFFLPQQHNHRQLYFSMLAEQGDIPGQIDDLSRCASRSFLQGQLNIAIAVDTDFPTDRRSLPGALHNAHDQVAKDYRRYLEARRTGSPRYYFSCRSHAMYFLRAVAPTKLVDGAWLYGLLQRWQDPRLASLIRTYLEELGGGNTQQNHVLIYQRLLARYGCDQWQNGLDEHFTQGAVQLALAHHADEFLPEVIGFNLGYEQLPLHLLITAYELNELDIDPYYFTLHVSIDNASTGHARMALQSVLNCIPKIGNVAEFYRRVGNGYRLNFVGAGTRQVIASFNPERELQRVLAEKASIGSKLHSDYCLVGGRPISEWLSSTDDIAALLQTLQSIGWIRRGEDPDKSHFWRLLTDEQAPMFGVFDGYELQLLKDWIRSDAGMMPTNPASNRFCNRTKTKPLEKATFVQSGQTLKQIIAYHAGCVPRPGHCTDMDALFHQLARVKTTEQAFAVLEGMLSPANHPTPAGLAATKLYADLFKHLT